MKLINYFFLGIAGVALSSNAWAQNSPVGGDQEYSEPQFEPEPITQSDDDAAFSEPAPELERDTLPAGVVAAAKKKEEIRAEPYKALHKDGRFEIAPFAGVVVNDTLIRHFGFGADLNYYLTDVLAVGATGMFYIDDPLEQEFRTRYHFGRVPSLNRYKFTATANFSYVPIYGKFALFNEGIVHFEFYAIGGVGITQSEVIPRDAANESFSNMALTFPVGVGARFHVTEWMAVQFSVRDYIMVDKFEPATRGVSGSAAKSNAQTAFVNNVMLNLGVSFFLPFSSDHGPE